jgi:hypothetical protein
VWIDHTRRFGDATVALDLDPLSLLSRLAASVPPPRAHAAHYAGVLAPAAKLRPLIVPPPAEPQATAAADGHDHDHDHERPERPKTHRSRYRPWAELMKRTFAADVDQCQSCGGRLKLVRFITRKDTIEKILRSLGEPTDAPGLSPARDPPFYKSQVLRRRAPVEQPQRELFAE